ARAGPAVSELPGFESQPVAGVLLDQIVGVVDDGDWRETNVSIADADVQVGAGALLGVGDEVRSERLEPQPGWELLLAGFVDEPDAADLAAAPDAAGEGAGRPAPPPAARRATPL